MKTRNLYFGLALLASLSADWAQTPPASGQGQNQTSSQSPGKDSETSSTQSLVSPLGLGTGATLAVTQKGTNVTAAVARQMSGPINFWQIGITGTLDKNSQQLVYSSSDSDAPGFKAKIGVGYSSMIRPWREWNRTAGDFLLDAWCLDLVTIVAGTLPAEPGSNLAKTVKQATGCREAVNEGKEAVQANPPLESLVKGGNQGVGKDQPSQDKQVDQRTKQMDEAVLTLLDDAADQLSGQDQANICKALAANAQFYKTCTNPIGLNDEKKKYPAIKKTITGEPPEFQWKAWGSWLPTVTSTAYQPLVNGLYDLSSKQNWTKLLNAGVGDAAFYYGRVAFGVEGGYGQTVKITPQNVCDNTTAGTYTAQQCNTAMLGQPKPVNGWLGSGTLQVTPLDILGKGVPFNLGAEVTFSYTAPTSGGHSSELAVPIFLLPTAKPFSVLIGLQPTWDWNTDPKIGNKFSVTLFVGARPSVPASVTK